MDELLAAGTYLGPLHGVPIGIKDIIHVAGVETSAGSEVLKGFVPSGDATVVRQLQAAGAIILGKTTTTQFALFDPAPTRNPHNLDHTPGGSSSGSAAAVAALQCFGAIGTQTLGSILRPAAYCGIVGFKPTYDLVSRAGIIPVAWSLDHVGPLARTVRDAALLFEAMCQPDFGCDFGPFLAPDNGARHKTPARPRVGVPDRFFFERTDPEMTSTYRDAIRRLERAGSQIREIRLPALFEAGVDAGYIVMRVEIAAFHQKWFASRANDYGPKLGALIEAGLRIQAVSYIRAQQIRRAAAVQMREVLRDIDVLATPSALGAAPKGTFTGDPIINAPFTIFGLPSLTVPVGRADTGLPFGLQLVADYFQDVELFKIGSAVEEILRDHDVISMTSKGRPDEGFN
jgi:aspartyl-tRNA(Asn)/glutamyl-tRNA(Gln) amidotransferase subunit A